MLYLFATPSSAFRGIGFIRIFYMGAIKEHLDEYYQYLLLYSNIILFNYYRLKRRWLITFDRKKISTQCKKVNTIDLEKESFLR
jgi:hypothetical protein